jgi:L-iditol 2-dehydrogenase
VVIRPSGGSAAAAPALAATMRAAILRDVRRIEVDDVPVPLIAPHEVLVAVEAVGLCGTDLHIFSGHANYHRDARGLVIPLAREPQILGHEIAGMIADIGSEVEDLRPGDRVVVDQGRTCVGERRTPLCEYCMTGDSHQCEWYAEHGITGLPGGLAEYVAVPAVNALAVTGDLSPVEAALTEPLGCVVHSTETLIRATARYRFGGERPIRSVLITGAGPAGLLFVQYLRRVLEFEGMLLVIEPDARKRALAERFGAETIDPEAVDPIDAVQDRTLGRRVELLIEASGSAAVFAAIPSLLRKQGTLLLYGHGHSGMDLSTMSGVQFMEPTLLTPVGASGGFRPDGRPVTYARALDLLESGRVEVGPMITHRYASLDGVPDAFAGDHRKPGYIKGVVTLNPEKS